MKELSYRDRIIIMVILVIVLIVIGISFLIKPKIGDVKTSQENFDKASVQWSEIENTINQIDIIKKRVETKYQEAVVLAEEFNGEKKAYEADQLLQNYFDANKINIVNFNVSDPTVTNMDRYNTEQNVSVYPIKDYADLSGKALLDDSDKIDNSASDVAEYVPESVLVNTITIEFNAEKNNLWNFLSEIKNSGKTIQIENLTINSYSFADGKSNGNMIINIYSAEPVSALDSEEQDGQTVNGENTDINQ